MVPKSRQIKHKREQLNRLKTQGLWQESGQQIQVLEREIENLSIQEELYWKQQRVNWLANGDKNSQVFSWPRLCSESKFVSGIVSSQGDWCSEKHKMTEIFVAYFSKLFTSHTPKKNDMRQVLDYVEPRMIDENLNSILCAPFLDKEIRKALFNLHPDKAPGPNITSFNIKST